VVSIPEFYRESSSTSIRFYENQKNLARNSHNGTLSAKAKSNLRNAIKWLTISASNKRVFCRTRQKSFRFKISFITLTLPDTDAPISNRDFQTKLLNPFLVYLRKYYNLKNYVWKLELQKNGKIHCHLTSDAFIHWRNVRNTWNRLLNNNGYLSKFKTDFGHSNPNSTDIHSVAHVKNIAAYLVKYLSKNPGEAGKISGRIWGCSYELSNANKAMVHVPASECSETLRCLYHKEINFKELIQEPTADKKGWKIGEMFFLNLFHWSKIITGSIKNKFIEVRNSISSPAQYFTEYEFNSV